MRFWVFLLATCLLIEAISCSGSDSSSSEECRRKKKCGANAVYTKCGKNPCLATCENPTLPLVCRPKPGCYPGCICKKGFLMNKKGVCRPEKSCYKCKKGEVFTKCDANQCQKTCAEPKKCKGVERVEGCVAGCVCDKGLLRNEANGKCVAKKDCPSKPKCTKANEVYSECGNHPCLNTCSEPDRIASCGYDGGCYPGCICAEGFLRKDEECVPRSTCFADKCTAENEEYTECGSACPITCANRNKNIACITLCVPGCFCKQGFIRDANGKCILPENCPVTVDIKCTGIREIYTECGNNSCVRNCDTYFLTDIACRPSCNPGCICEEGYTRNSKGICVTPDKCDVQCTGENEQFTECVCPCCETCATLGQNVTCNFLVCNPGCDCKPGFFRNSKGVCVAPKDCDCKENEFLSLCSTPCPPQTCQALGRAYKCPATECKPACICEFNYRRDSNGICIPIKECPPRTCSNKNEVFDSCPVPCFDESCESLNKQKICDKKGRECAPQCVCKEGYLRDKNGVCIPKEKCEKPCKDNEVYSSCPRVCPPEPTCESSLSGLIYLCAEEPEPRECNPRCECAPGYVRKVVDGECIKAEACCEDPNAEVVGCPNPCPGGTCEAPKFADCKAPCKIRGCQCKSGYVKDSNGKCILLSECPKSQCKKNEVYKGCGTKCPATCDNRNPICTKQCSPGCFCVDGYILNKGVCIPIEECPKENTCKGVNEEYKDCGTACPTTCENKDKPIICTKQCVQGCFCKSGFVRKDGVCVDPEECPKQETCSGVNEEYTDCGTACPLTCENKDENFTCTAQCVKGCFCKAGFVRKDGICVNPEECNPVKCKKNEAFNSCGTKCPATCDNRNPICTKQCVPGCYCVKGYILNNGVCIPIEKCPKKETCSGVNEEFQECGTACPLTCENKDENVACTDQCVRGCFCKGGFVRKDGVCVQPEECNPVKCKKNEAFNSCGTKCPATCDNRNPICTKQCVPGCYCVKGYILNNGVCIPIEKCPKKETCSGVNEEFQECGTACPLTCENKDESIICTANCVQGCFCKAGFVRKDGICVKPEECPPATPKCKKNEAYNTCGTKCPATCDNRDPICTKQCVPGCFCTEGYILNKAKGECILIEKCPKSNTCKGANEEYQNCGTACPKTCENKDKPIFCTKQCVQGCFCKAGFVRKDGVCVKPEECAIVPIHPVED